MALVARPVGRVRLAQRQQQIGPRRVVDVQQIAEAAPEILVLAARGVLSSPASRLRLVQPERPLLR